MIADIVSNKKFNPKIFELFIRGIKLSISHNHVWKYWTALDLPLHIFYYENSK